MPGPIAPFAAATAVSALDGGRFAGEVHDGWDIAGNANGGYLLAVAARAMREASGRPDPVSITAHYLRPGRPGPVTVDTEVVKEGKTFVSVRANLLDVDDRPLLSLIGTFGTLSRTTEVAAHHELVDAAPPELPPFEDCKPRQHAPGVAPGFMERVDLRLHPEDSVFADGQRSGSARMRGWFAFPEGTGGEREEVDTIGLLQATDAFPPTIFNVDLPVGWVPTVELTAHVRARPAPGPLRCVFTTRFVTGGFLEEDGEVWDATGRLVAQSRQLALVPRS
ncbi:MAG TPA: thioesterase family protein [Acidimicrobiales bacterium]|nr:thioesterase family protein [Acidimicrobiales bacterium]